MHRECLKAWFPLRVELRARNDEKALRRWRNEIFRLRFTRTLSFVPMNTSRVLDGGS